MADQPQSPSVPDVPAIDVQQLKQKLDAGEAGQSFELIDVRQPHEHEICHLRDAALVPLDTLSQRVHEFDSEKRYIVHCKKGIRSARAVAFLRQAGIEAINVEGGITAWAQQIDPTMPTY